MSWWTKSIAWLGKFISYIVKSLPRSWQDGLACLLGFLWFDVFRMRRQVVLNNIQKAFPLMSYQERLKVGRISMQNQCRVILEYCRIPFLTRQQVKESFIFEGVEHLEKAFKKDKGVLLLTLHLGNGDLAALGLAILGWPMYMVSKVFSWKWLNDLWFGMRERQGLKIILPRNSSYAILKALKRHGIVIFALDQFTGPPIGVRTKFFGHETGTALGLAIMAERSGASVVPAYTFRNKEGKTVVCFEAEIPMEISTDRDQSLEKMTQVYTDQLEVFVKKHPTQWMWLHRRWKEYRVT